MILQSLCQYYERKAKDPNLALARLGFETRAIAFIIVIDSKGKFISIQDCREQQGKKKFTPSFTIPQLPQPRKAKDTVIEEGATAGLGVDHFGYVLGQAKLDKKTKTYLEKEIKLANLQFTGFKNKLKELNKIIPEDKGLEAIANFYSDDENFAAIKEAPEWDEIIKKEGTFLAFKLAGVSHLICQSEAVVSYVEQSTKKNKGGFCLVSGEEDEIARTHNAVNLIGGTNPKLVSFNKRAFESYGKSQSFNSPIGEKISFQYSTALNFLLKNNSTNFRIDETSYICWADKENYLENNVTFFFNEDIDDPDKGANAIKQLMNTLNNGAYQQPDGQNEFYVLGLSPNSARISVRFWQKSTVAEFSEHLGCWFNDLDIIGRDHYGYSPLKSLLKSIVFANKEKNIPPNLIGEVTRSVLAGTQLPVTLINAILRRIKAEQGIFSGYNGFHRVSLLKAYLNRKNRFYNFKQQEVTVSLNQDETRIGYCLGRLFSALEKLQEDAHGGKLNSTIRDKYYSSASSTPKTVFGTLMRLSTHHFKKLDNPAFKVVAEKRIGEIMALIPEFPAHLNLDNQGLFAIGYYHQKQAFFKKKTTEQGE